MKFRPLHDWVVIKRSKPVEMTTGGIIIPDAARDKPSEGTVSDVGPGRYKQEKGKKEKKFFPTVLKPGQKVMFIDYMAKDVDLDGAEITLIREDDILGIIAQGGELKVKREYAVETKKDMPPMVQAKQERAEASAPVVKQPAKEKAAKTAKKTTAGKPAKKEKKAVVKKPAKKSGAAPKKTALKKRAAKTVKKTAEKKASPKKSAGKAPAKKTATRKTAKKGQTKQTTAKKPTKKIAPKKATPKRTGEKTAKRSRK